MIHHALIRRCILAAGLLLAGCAQFDMKKTIPWGAGENGEFPPPMKLVCMWQDTVMQHGPEKPIRGFGGRLMFYGPDNQKPIKVDGTLEVYAFEESQADPFNAKPSRKYVFTAEQFKKHYSKNALGHSYSFWLPWDEAGGPQQQISLIARFTPESGGAVIASEQTQHLLPGTPPEELSTDYRRYMPGGKAAKAALHAASYTRPAPADEAADEGTPTSAEEPGEIESPPAPDRKRMQTTTIDLPPRMSRFLAPVVHHGMASPYRQARGAAPADASAAQTGLPEENTPPPDSGSPQPGGLNTAGGASPHNAVGHAGSPGFRERRIRHPVQDRELPVGYRRGKSQVLGAPLERLGPDHAQTPPRPVGPPRPPGYPLPRSSMSGSASNGSAAGPAP
jgi:hypothetical protein